jgi:hypothetical protein
MDVFHQLLVANLKAAVSEQQDKRESASQTECYLLKVEEGEGIE